MYIVKAINPLGKELVAKFETKEKAVGYIDNLGPEFDAFITEKESVKLWLVYLEGSETLQFDTRKEAEDYVDSLDPNFDAFIDDIDIFVDYNELEP